MGSHQAVIPPPPDGSGIVYPKQVPPPPDAIPPPPDGSGIVYAAPAQAAPNGGSSGSWEEPTSLSNLPKRVAKNFGENFNPVQMAKGAFQMVAHPSDTLQADVDARGKLQDEAKQDFSEGNIAHGVGRTIQGLVPLLGPALAQRSDQVDSGDVAGGLAGAAGLGLSAGLPEALRGVKIKTPLRLPAEGVARSLYKSAIKPPVTMSPAKSAALVETGLEGSVGLSKGKRGLGRVNEKIDTSLKGVDDAVKGIDEAAEIRPERVASRTDALEARKGDQVNSVDDVATVRASKEEFLDRFRKDRDSPTRGMSAVEAQKIKQATSQSLGERAYGELKTPAKEAQKQLARGLKEELETLAPELKELNKTASDNIKLKKVVERALERESNKQPLGVGHGIAAVAGTAAGVLGTAGAGAATAAGGLLLNNARFRAGLAIALNKASKGKVTVPLAKAAVGNYLGNLLGRRSATQETE